MSNPVKITLVVCGGFIVCGVLLVLTLPTLDGRSTIAAHETSVFQTLRLLNAAEVVYSATYPEHGFACSLAALGGNSASGAPTPEAAQIIEDDLVSGRKAGYTFVVSDCSNKTTNNHEQFSSYKITAVPVLVGRTGRRGFCTDESGEIRFDPRGGTNCTEVLQ